MTNNGTVNAVGTAIDVNTAFGVIDGGNATVNGSGSITSTASNAVTTTVDTGNVLIDGLAGGITGAVNGIVSTAFNGTTAITNNGPITGNGGFGIFTTATTGATTIDSNGLIKGTSRGVDSSSSTGDIAVTNNTAGITSTLDDGVWVHSVSGNMNVSNNGPVSGAVEGIAAWTGGAGTVNVDNNGDVTGTAGFGITTIAGTGATSVTGNGAILGGLRGVDAASTTGAIAVNNNASITSTFDDGVWAHSVTGNVEVNNNGPVLGAVEGIAAWTAGAGTVDVNNNASVTGTAGYGITTIAATGPTNIQGNGNIVGDLDGILATSGSGPVNIGTTATNGTVTGGAYGIHVEAASSPVAIKVDENVTGTAIDGIYAHSVTGPITIDILDPAVVEGGTRGLTVSTLDKSIVNNFGTVRQIGDTGLSNDPGGVAIYSPFGDNVVNNKAGGEIVGTIFTGGTKFTLNNEAGGIWTPGTNAANVAANAFTLNDVVNNAGLINVREGRTTLTSLGNLNNQSGGVIDMTYAGTSPKATDAVDVVNFRPLAGSTVKFNVDYTLANSTGTEALANDHASDGKGTADTIVVFGKAFPQATSLVDLVFNQKAAVGTSGSIALVNAVAAGLPDPGPGGFATMIASSKYVFVSDPSTGAVVYRLVEDSNGGVHLQWAPNLSAASLGAFGGATGVGSEGGPSEGAAIAMARGASNGVLGSGPGGGGAANRIADMAAGSALRADDFGQPVVGGGSLKDGGGAGAECTRSRSAWAQGEASRSNYDVGGDGRAENFSGGLETGLGDIEGRGCNRVAVGVFGFAGQSDTSWTNGSADTENAGVGGYIRASHASGLYASALASWSWADNDLVNNIYGTTAKSDSDGFTTVGTLGYVSRIGAQSALDIRSYVAYGNINGDAFTDSAGIVVSGTDDRLFTVGGLIGLHTALTDTTQGFIRGGVKWSELDSSISSAGGTQKGRAEETAGSVEVGFATRVSQGVEFGASGFGEFSDSADTYGGRAHVKVDF